MSTKINWELLASYIAGEYSNKEEQEIKAWLQSDSDNQALLDSLQRIWNGAEYSQTGFNKKAFWTEVKYKVEIASLSSRKARTLSMRHHITKSRILKIAAILFITISLPYLVKQVMSIRTSSPQMKEILVEMTKRTTVTLADSSRVTLDAGSVLTFTPEFRGQTREVFLQGEAYFEVTKNAQKPFIIHASDAVIKVLGTKFNIRAWSQNQRVKVVVAEGNVSFRSKDDAEEDAIVISKGQLSILPENDKPTKPRYVEVEKYLAWLNNELFFEETPLNEVLDQLNRWYNLEFHLTHESIALLPLTAHFRKKPIEDILESMSVVLELKYQRVGSRVIFSPKHSK